LLRAGRQEGAATQTGLQGNAEQHTGRERSNSTARKTAGRTRGDRVGLGPCPLCGADVIDRERSYGCSGWRGGCKFAIWKTVAGKKLGVRTAQALLRKGRSALLKGFKSKAGKSFDARLKLEDGAVRFDFEA
jgi:DNA topoisomerase-3